jgi:hypothetical protein
MAIIVFPTQQNTWVHQVLPDRVSNFLGQSNQDDTPQRAIDYLPTAGRYSDRVEEALSESDDEGTPQNTVERGVRQIRNALPSTGHDEERPHMHVENEWSRN